MLSVRCAQNLGVGWKQSSSPLVTCYSGKSDEPHSSLMRTCLLSHLLHSQLQSQVTVGTYNAGYKSGKSKYMSREYLKVGFHPRMLIVNV